MIKIIWFTLGFALAFTLGFTLGFALAFTLGFALAFTLGFATAPHKLSHTPNFYTLPYNLSTDNDSQRIARKICFKSIHE